MQRLVRLSVLGTVALTLAACPPPPPRPTYPDITFTDKPPINLDVAEIKIDVPYIEPLDAPHVGESFPVPPLRAARNWVQQRLRAVGRSGSVTVTIVEAGAVEAELKQAGGLKGLFTKQQAQRYDVTINMQILAIDPVGPRTARAGAQVRRSTTVPENADLNQREEIQYKLTKDAMAEFDKAMESQIRQHLTGFVR